MALPEGVITAIGTVGVPVSFSGIGLRSNVSIEPSVQLVHTTTGTPLVNMVESIFTTNGAAGQFTLPVVDQDGFQDEAGNPYKNWYYTMTIQYGTDRNWFPAKTKVFQLLMGQTIVDLDLLPSGAPAMPYSAPVARVTDVNGKTNSVSVIEATPENVAAVLPARLSAESIAAGLAPKLDAETAATTYAAKSVETTKLDAAKVGVADGVAPLGPDTRVPDANLPVRLGLTELNATYGPAAESFRTAFVGRTHEGVKVPRPNQIITNFQAGHGFTILGTTVASMVDDTTDFAVGTQSLAVTTKTDGLGGSVQAVLPAVDATGDSFMLTVKVDDTTNLTELILFAASDNYTNYYQWTIQDAGLESQRWFKSGDWATITLNFADAAVIGTPNRAALTNFRVRAGCATGFYTTVRYNRLATIPQAPVPVVSIAIDDIYASTWTHLRPRTDKYGFPVTCYAIPSRTNLVSLAQLHILEDASGWEIAGHNDGTGFNTIPLAEAEAAVVMTKKWLQDNGFRGVDHYAYVGGQYNPAVELMMRKYYKAARSIVSRTAVESLPPANAYRIRSRSVSNTTTAASVKAAITNAVNNGGWYVLTLHDIVDGAAGAATGSSQYTTADLEDILAHIAASGAQVKTVGDVLADMTPVREPSTIVTEAKAGSGAVTHAALGNAADRINTIPRALVSAGITPASGRADLGTFSPAVDMTITKLAAMSSATVWAGATLARMGLYTVDAAGAVTLVAQTASDTTLFTAANTVYQKALDTAGGYPGSYKLIAGKQYAVGVIGVGQTAGTLRGGSAASALAARPPIMGGTLGSGLTDLPTSGTITATGTYPWAELAA